jgi:tetratricopeptide (TPR) repeat protein
MRANLMKSLAATLALGFAIPLAAQTVSPAVAAADALYQAQKWSEAATAYAAIAKGEPTNARAWFRSGVALHQLGKYSEAVASYQKAIDNGKGKPLLPFAMYNLAASYARMGEKAKALDWLGQVVSNNPAMASGIAIDPDFASIQSESQFKAYLSVVEKNQKPCMFTEGYRQFDFWVGEWDVFVSGQKAGYNNVKSLQNGCIIEENWEGGSGERGQSFNFFNPVTGKWHQSYMSNRAGNWMMDGEYKDGQLRFEGHIYSPQGDVLVHMTFFNLEPGKVRQTAETSSDGGKTWTNIWDGLYVRKSSGK